MLKISENLKKHLLDTVPIPEPKQFGKGEMISVDGSQCCLVGWARVAVGGGPYHCSTTNRYDAASELAKLVSENDYPVEWNDVMASREEVAERWVDTMRALGYKIENQPWEPKR